MGSEIFDSRNAFAFLQDGGEMGALTREFDWKKTPLGAPGEWSQSLRTTVGILLHSAFPMFLFWGKELTCFYNDAFRPSLGIDGKHPALGKTGKEVWAEIWEFIGPLIDKVMTTGQPVWFEDQLVPFYRNGRMEDIYWTFSYSPAYGDDGQVNGVFVTCTETTQKVKTIRKAEESEQQVRAVIEAAPFPIGVYTGSEMRISFANQSMLDVWGKGNELTGKLYTEILPELEDSGIFQQLDDVYTSGNPFDARNQRVDLVIDGKLQPYYFNYSFTPLRDITGKIYGVMNTAAEVTDLHLAKQQVEESEKYLRNIILQAPVAMCIMLGPDHVIDVANGFMISIWGKSEEDVVGKPVFEALPEAKEQGLEQLIAHVYNTGETFRATERPVELIRNGRLETVYQDFVYEPHRDSGGVIKGVLAISIDVTAQVLARQKIEEIVADRTLELAEANANLERSNAELEQFAYIASHDLQEPLRKVSTFSQMLEQSLGDIDMRSRGYLDKINNSTARMINLVRDVLTYSQLSKERLASEPVDLKDTIDAIRMDYELMIEQKHAQIIYDELPVIEAIPLQMSQLFSNIISNALKFLRSDVDPLIVITARRADKEILQRCSLPAGNDNLYYSIEIKDNGIGFDQRYAVQIFNIFQRLHGKTDYKGTGIGLAMCKKIVQNHHGAIYATSKPGQGAAFTVILPVRQRFE